MNDVRQVVVGKTTLWTERLGEPARPAVLLIAGAAMQATAWEQPFTDALLRAGRSVIRFDWRDIGLSTWARFRDRPYTVDDLTSDAVAVLDAYEELAADVIGFSMGGCIAQLMALHSPTRVRSLTLLSSGYASRIETERDARGRELFELFVQAPPADRRGQAARLVDQWRVLCGEAFPFDEAAWRRRVGAWLDRGQNPGCPHVRLGPQVFTVDRVSQLADVTIPTRVVHGDDDPMFPLPHGLAIAATIPGASIEVLGGRGHDLFLDAELAGSIGRELVRA